MVQKKTPPATQTLQQQLDGEKRLVSFDSYDLSVRRLLDVFESGEIDVPPEYQRQAISATRGYIFNCLEQHHNSRGVIQPVRRVGSPSTR